MCVKGSKTCFGNAPTSRGSIHLPGANPLTHRKFKLAIYRIRRIWKNLKIGVQRARESGNEAELRPYAKREYEPAKLSSLPNFLDVLKTGVVPSAYDCQRQTA